MQGGGFASAVQHYCPLSRRSFSVLYCVYYPFDKPGTPRKLVDPIPHSASWSAKLQAICGSLPRSDMASTRAFGGITPKLRSHTFCLYPCDVFQDVVDPPFESGITRPQALFGKHYIASLVRI